jgi:hypothetical protein
VGLFIKSARLGPPVILGDGGNGRSGCDVGNRQMMFPGCAGIRNSPEWPGIMTAHCKNKWGDSGLSFRYTLHVGCMVEVNGNGLPEANVEIHP